MTTNTLIGLNFLFLSFLFFYLAKLQWCKIIKSSSTKQSPIAKESEPKTNSVPNVRLNGVNKRSNLEKAALKAYIAGHQYFFWHGRQYETPRRK